MTGSLSLQIFVPLTLGKGRRWRFNTERKKKKKGKGNWLNNELPYASCLILLNSSKHCKWHGQFWCLSTQYLRDFYPTDMLVTEWYKFETGRCLSYAYDDFLCRIISFFHFFLNRVQEKLKCLDSLKGIFFSCWATISADMNVVFLLLSKILLVTG